MAHVGDPHEPAAPPPRFALLSKHSRQPRAPRAAAHPSDDWKAVRALWSSSCSRPSRQTRRGHHRRHHGGRGLRGKLHIGYLGPSSRRPMRAARAAWWRHHHPDDDVDRRREPLHVLDAYIAAVAAMLFLRGLRGEAAARLLPIMKHTPAPPASTGAVGIVATILVAAIAANVVANLYFNQVLDHFPVIGVASGSRSSPPPRSAGPTGRCCGCAQGDDLPAGPRGLRLAHAGREAATASWPTTLGLGFSRPFSTTSRSPALALKQGGYDWAFSPTRSARRLDDLVRLQPASPCHGYPERKAWDSGCATAGTSRGYVWVLRVLAVLGGTCRRSAGGAAPSRPPRSSPRAVAKNAYHSRICSDGCFRLRGVPATHDGGWQRVVGTTRCTLALARGLATTGSCVSEPPPPSPRGNPSRSRFRSTTG